MANSQTLRSCTSLANRTLNSAKSTCACKHSRSFKTNLKARHRRRPELAQFVVEDGLSTLVVLLPDFAQQTRTSEFRPGP